MIKKRFVLPALAAVAALTLAGCTPAGSSAADSAGKLQVVATTTQVADLTRNVVGDTEGVSLTQLIQPNQSAHSYDPSVADLTALGNADVLVINGVGLEEWLDDAISASGFDGVTIDSDTGIEIQDVAAGDEHADEEDHADDTTKTDDAEHSHEGGNPHIWTDVSNAETMVGTIAAGLADAKPDLATAQRLYADGKHVWNSGMFVATASTLIAELHEHAPEVLAAARAALTSSQRDLDFIRLGAEEFRKAPAISIDYAVMERTRQAAVVPADLGWSDVGSWDALWETSVKDADQNVLQGPVEALDSSGCFVRSEGLLTAVLGLRDVVVVVTDDAVLALPRDRAQDVKKVVERLKARGVKQAAEHRRMYRPWGHYEGLIMGDRFQVKQIVVMPGGRLSLQKHHHRAEHWVVVRGTARVQRDAESLLLSENQSVYLPLGCVHRLENPGMIPLALIEVQVCSYLGEDDIVRIEDTYGRR